MAVTSGANMNFDRLRLVADLANYGLRTEAMLTCTIPEQPGSFRAFIETIFSAAAADEAPATSGPPGSRSGIDITEFKYRFSVDRPAKVLMSMSASTPQDIAAVVARLNNAAGDFVCEDVTDNALAQVHLRHMVGGRPRSYSGVIENERFVSVRSHSVVATLPFQCIAYLPLNVWVEGVQVTFPEKVGALRQFLQALDASAGMNVTMFHYRGTGNRASSVLLGLQIPPGCEGAYAAVQEALAPLDFVFEELSEENRKLFDQFVS